MITTRLTVKINLQMLITVNSGLTGDLHTISPHPPHPFISCANLINVEIPLLKDEGNDMRAAPLPPNKTWFVKPVRAIRLTAETNLQMLITVNSGLTGDLRTMALGLAEKIKTPR